MTAPSLLDLPQAQAAMDYAIGKLADWQLVPQRLSLAQSEVGRLGREAGAVGNTVAVARLTLVKQSLAGIQSEYTASLPLVSVVMQSVRTVQAGGNIGTAAIADAARLVTIMAANLGALHQNEREIVALGGRLAPGSGAGLGIPGWVKWLLIGLGALWFLRRMRVV